MYAMTGTRGSDDHEMKMYMPPAEYGNWNQVMEQNDLQIRVTPNNSFLY
jgi:hypothetical protein